MPGSRSSNDPEHKSPRESGEDSEDESEILEESPCGRWLKRREEVEQRDVPGIDSAYLAMDTEEGVEVVWNEVQFSERKNFKAQEEKIQQVFENLTQLEHPNIVKFHRYWTDTHNDKPRVIFITEYMSSGSLKQFLKRTKRNVKKLPLQAWKRWCTQILSALSYLHSCSPPIIHGNLTCDTIFIQHNGLVKIGSVAPDAIHHHVKTCRDNMKNMHFVAPEYGVSVTPAIDVYSFGMCALEMAALEIQGNGESGNQVTEENIIHTIESLDNDQQKDFIYKCLNKEPGKRPSARELLFHPLLFEVHSLKLLAAHALVRGKASSNLSESITDEVVQKLTSPDVVVGEIIHPDRPGVEFKMADVPVSEKLEKFVEDVKYGIYPLTVFAARQPPPPNPRSISPEISESVKSITPEPLDVEIRRVVNMVCSIKFKEETSELLMTLLLRMDDKMNRQLTCAITETDNSLILAQELVHFGFINEADQERMASLIEDALRNCFTNPVPSADDVMNNIMMYPSVANGNEIIMTPEGPIRHTDKGSFLMTSQGPVRVSTDPSIQMSSEEEGSGEVQTLSIATEESHDFVTSSGGMLEQIPEADENKMENNANDQEPSYGQGLAPSVNGQGLSPCCPDAQPSFTVEQYVDQESTCSGGDADQASPYEEEEDEVTAYTVDHRSSHTTDELAQQLSSIAPVQTPGYAASAYSDQHLYNRHMSTYSSQMPGFITNHSPYYAAGQLPSYPGNQFFSFAPGQIPTLANGQIHAYSIGNMPVMAINQVPTLATSQVPNFANGQAQFNSDEISTDNQAHAATIEQEAGAVSQTPSQPHSQIFQAGNNLPATAQHMSAPMTMAQIPSFPNGYFHTFAANGQIYAYVPRQGASFGPGQIANISPYQLPTFMSPGQIPMYNVSTVAPTVLTPADSDEPVVPAPDNAPTSDDGTSCPGVEVSSPVMTSQVPITVTANGGESGDIAAAALPTNGVGVASGIPVPTGGVSGLPIYGSTAPGIPVPNAVSSGIPLQANASSNILIHGSAVPNIPGVAVSGIPIPADTAMPVYTVSQVPSVRTDTVGPQVSTIPKLEVTASSKPLNGHTAAGSVVQVSTQSTEQSKTIVAPSNGPT